jgi:hypothetical protein
VVTAPRPDLQQLRGPNAMWRPVTPSGTLGSLHQRQRIDRPAGGQGSGPAGRDVGRPNVDIARQGKGPTDRIGQNVPPQARPDRPFQLAGGRHGIGDRVLRNPAFAGRNVAGRDLAARTLASSTFHGRFFHPDWRRQHHRPIVIGWLGPLFWPYASSDFVDYTFYPYAYDTFWPNAYDDLYEGMFGRYSYGGAYASVGRPQSDGGGRTAAADLCTGRTAGLSDWPIEQIAQTVEPTDAQRTALDAFKDATVQALEVLKASCPTELPSTPTGRLAAMHQRLAAMLEAVRTVRPALEQFYGLLNDEQKARFNAIGPDDQSQSPRDIAQTCGERTAGIASLPIAEIERSVRPDGTQRVAFKELEDATAQAVELLKSDCPTYRALTPVVRLGAMEQRLDAMLRAVTTVEPALLKFYGSLSDEQKERFNRLSPRQA